MSNIDGFKIVSECVLNELSAKVVTKTVKKANKQVNKSLKKYTNNHGQNGTYKPMMKAIKRADRIRKMARRRGL